ncbi:hypothetical protein BO86DRAFT_138477 [Aspergillus japonicus CBS 114.51]|uniref:Apple domain-containing protein n=1 Tax=Aspergillus japonicus CBS 114.51 TaxID=1448312 RepID=A0A8T8XD37_ASPJA|nr:hypothetical protein BO86DRAFT_138477 [Aspergillus japonicus CBS 114.51]RAH86035.1 hypothetical protein BO86DRAFT_138477 [Aspergillus japonicus CBS 114.51]
MGNLSRLLTVLSAGSAAWATQAPLGSANTGANQCLSMTGGAPHTNFDACCGSGSSGRGTVDGVEFTYTCGQWATPYATKPVNAASARECAQLCAAAGAQCPAAAWMSKGQCYFITSGAYSVRPLKGILLLEKTGKLVAGEEPTEPEGGCDKAAEEAKTQCEKEAAERCEADKTRVGEQCKADCAKQVASVTEQCNADKAKLEEEMNTKCRDQTAAAVQDQIAKCEKEKTDLGGSCDDLKKQGEAQCEKDKAAITEEAKKQCDADKTVITEDARKQCDADKSAITEDAKKQCDADKSAITEDAKKQCDADKSTLTSACDAEKDRLQKALDEANEKLKKLEGSGGGTSASTTSPANEALLEEIARENFSTICPKFGGKTFITVDSKGYKHEWTLYCHTGVTGQSNPNYNWSCHTQNIIQLLKEQQERSDLKALWVNTNNVCTPWTGGYVNVGGPFTNHHLVMPTRQPWK